MEGQFESSNAALILGAGASRADGGVLEADLMPAIHRRRSLTMNIPASEFAQQLSYPNPTYSFGLGAVLRER